MVVIQFNPDCMRLHVNNTVPDWGIKDQGGDHPEDNGQEGDLTQVLVPEQVQERDSASVPTKKTYLRNSHRINTIVTKRMDGILEWKI